MNVVLVHNFYMQPGGEDQVVAAEAEILRAHGHDVRLYTIGNESLGAIGRLDLARKTLWNADSYQGLRNLIREAESNVVHVHNTLPLVSPAVYYAAKVEGSAVVQTLHNYRPFCLNGVFFRDGRVCTDCLGRFPLSGIFHKCYRGSAISSLGVSAIRLIHYDILRTFERKIDTYIASTEFVRNLAVEMGLPEGKLVVKPNPVKIVSTAVAGGRVPSAASSSTRRAVFVGRLDARKGIWTLLNALERVSMPLTLIGDGDLRLDIERWLHDHPNQDVHLMGWQTNDKVMGHLEDALVLVHPSEFFESFGNVIVEAFSCGVPVITTNIGAQSTLVDHGRTGLQFTPGDAAELANALNWLISHPTEADAMGAAARAEYEAKYTAEANYEQLIAIYEHAITEARSN